MIKFDYLLRRGKFFFYCFYFLQNHPKFEGKNHLDFITAYEISTHRVSQILE